MRLDSPSVIFLPWLIRNPNQVVVEYDKNGMGVGVTIVVELSANGMNICGDVVVACRLSLHLILSASIFCSPEIETWDQNDTEL